MPAFCFDDAESKIVSILIWGCSKSQQVTEKADIPHDAGGHVSASHILSDVNLSRISCARRRSPFRLYHQDDDILNRALCRGAVPLPPSITFWLLSFPILVRESLGNSLWEGCGSRTDRKKTQRDQEIGWHYIWQTDMTATNLVWIITKVCAQYLCREMLFSWNSASFYSDEIDVLGLRRTGFHPSLRTTLRQSHCVCGEPRALSYFSLAKLKPNSLNISKRFQNNIVVNSSMLILVEFLSGIFRPAREN